MSIPHDYYGPYGDTVHLHSRGHNRPYVEPDYIGYDCDHQLPLVSSVGAGPRGHGILANVEEHPTAGVTIVNFTDDVTGETVASTGNINGGYIWVETPEEDKVWEGQTSWFKVHVCRGDDNKVYSVPVPAGAHGSRMYIYPDPLERSYPGKHPSPVKIHPEKQFSGEEVYSASDFYAKATFCGYGSSAWKDYPLPRPCDTVAFQAVDGNRRWLALGFIQAVEGNYAVWTAKTFIELSSPYIDKEGEWCVNGEKTGYKALPEIHGDTWYINGVSTGVKAQGPQGKQGIQGEKGEPGKQGLTGPQGEPGRDAKVSVGKVESLEPTQPATVTSKYDPKTNVTTLDFGIPEGAAGRAIIIDGGIYKYEDLPDWKSTPFNYAYIVDDGDGRYDLYIRGRVEADSELGGPWTVVEDWEGKPAIIEEVTVEYAEEGLDPWVDLRYTNSIKANKYAFDFHLASPDLSEIHESIDNLENEIDYLNTKLDKEIEDRKTDIENLNEKLEAEKLARETEDENLRALIEVCEEACGSKFAEMESKIADLTNQLEQEKQAREELETTLGDKITELEEKIKDLEEQLEDIKNQVPEEDPSSSYFFMQGNHLWVKDNFDDADFYINEGRLYATVDNPDLRFYTESGHVYAELNEKE